MVRVFVVYWKLMFKIDMSIEVKCILLVVWFKDEKVGFMKKNV